jgi:hypothetical protein
MDEGSLTALLRKPQDQQMESKWRGPYLREMPLDPWGHRLDYRPLPSSSGTAYRLWSSGPDGISGTLTPGDLTYKSGLYSIMVTGKDNHGKKVNTEFLTDDHNHLHIGLPRS